MNSDNQNQPDAAAIAREIRAQEAEEKKAKDAAAAKKAGQGCLIFIVVIVLIGVAIAVWPSNGSSSPEAITLPNGTTITSSEAVVRCRDVIRGQLLSPSSASFPGPFSDRYTRPVKSGNVWRYVAHVDAQNAFGVTLPSSWNCVLDGNTGEISVIQR